MATEPEIDARALKILRKYDVLAALYAVVGYPLDARQQEYMEKHSTSPEDMAYLKQHGLAFDMVDIAHDEAVRKCFEYYALLDKKHVTNLFLASLSSHRLDWRSGLSAYAIMQTMPDHPYDGNAARFCKICSAAERNHLDLTGLNKQRFSFGSLLVLRTPYEIQFFLQQHAELANVEPTSADFAIFNAIVALIKTLDEDAKPNQVTKKLRTVKGFKASIDQCRCFLETLGLCSILETEKHKGYLTQYTAPGFSPSKSHSSDWAYPVDFWTGKDGINRDAFQFWFGGYKEIRL
jgi:hypothetical protein